MSYLTPPTTPNTQTFKSNSSSHSAHNVPVTPPFTPLLNDKQAPQSRTFLLTPPDTPALDASVRRLSVDGQSRPMSDNELSYYLPSRQDGVNDMYVHHTLCAPEDKMDRERILHAWAYQLLRHPLLASTVHSTSYTDVSFHHSPPTTLSSALDAAARRLIYNSLGSQDNIARGSQVGMIDRYLNGPRTLSSERLAVLFIGAPENPKEQEYQVMLTTTHFIGDGMALHTFMNEFYILIESDRTTADFEQMINEQLGLAVAIPSSLEDRLPKPAKAPRLAMAVGAEEYTRSEQKLVGGQSFPGPATKKDRKTVVPTFAYDEAQTKVILGNCKKNGVTIAHAMFALCNIAWARQTKNRADPTLIYSALNLRPNTVPICSSPNDTSYFHLAVGYFNIILPTSIPSALTPAELFWHRARSTKSQTTQAVKSPFVVSRSRQTSKVRAERAIKWAGIDDAAAAKAFISTQVGLGLGVDMPNRSAPTRESEENERTPEVRSTNPSLAPVRAVESTPPQPSTPATKSDKSNPAVLPPVNQKALMGLSMLGNLDGMYKHASYPALRLTSLTTGSRQRPGALLLFAYTFAGKLWLSLGYDMNGFAPGSIEAFWTQVQDLVKEVLL
ncbi:hypothetical protein BCR39DRAFT_526980 [Naematelia encephala]|uniref:Alcohol acetyltransferase n=1 Tax=Naematelia encephala TaxID=71784 RepID=A0A1Y2B8Z0_9TREE|nr:hypothetical protein BCR39DRAFT_526980 [Naematelia encephala]